MTNRETTPDAPWREAIAELPARKHPFAVDIPGERVWIKPARHRTSRAWHLLHAAVARLLRLSLFRPPVYRTGRDQIAGEARRLAALAARGLPVPVVRAHFPDYLVLSDNGQSIHDMLFRLDHGARLDLLAAALDFVLDVHRRGAWHGACQVRNITRREDGFGLIDFEDDMEGAAPLATLQARDIVQFMMSAARHLDRDQVSAIGALLGHAAKASSVDTRAELERLARRLRFLRHAARPMGMRLGRDGRDLAVLVLALDAVFPRIG